MFGDWSSEYDFDRYWMDWGNRVYFEDDGGIFEFSSGRWWKLEQNLYDKT